jgi:hypothetical protein
MSPTPKIKHFELIEHNFLPNWNGKNNESFGLQPFTSKFQDFEIFVLFDFSSSPFDEHVLS